MKLAVWCLRTQKMQKGKLTQKVGQVPKENLAQYHAVNILFKFFIEILVEILVEKQITNGGFRPQHLVDMTGKVIQATGYWNL